MLGFTRQTAFMLTKALVRYGCDGFRSRLGLLLKISTDSAGRF